MGGSGSRENAGKKPVVLIVGGGYGGVQCAQTLDKTGRFFVVLIERKSYFLHNIAALRASVEPEVARRIVVPYDRLLTNGCVVQAEVVSIAPNGVQVHGRNEPIPFDYLVIATGSSYAFPGKVAEPEMSKAIDLYHTLRQTIDKSHQILVIGGGPVGVELAAEIATDFPEKEVTLVHSQPTLLEQNVFSEKMYRRTQEELEKLNVKLVLNDRVVLPGKQDLNYIEGQKSYVTERSRTTINADLTFLCTGARTNTRSLANSPLKSKVNPQTGRLIVNNYLQVDGFENIFAIGDICDKEAKYAYIAADQGTYVAKLIPVLHAKKPYPKEYQPHANPMMFLSIGRNAGVGQMPNKGGTVVGSFLVKHVKSKDMFVSRFRGMLNYKSDNQQEKKSAYANRIDSVQSILSFNEEDARSLLAGLPAKQLEPGQDFI